MPRFYHKILMEKRHSKCTSWVHNHIACKALETHMPGQAGVQEPGGSHSLSREGISLLTPTQSPRSYTEVPGQAGFEHSFLGATSPIFSDL